MNNQMSNIVKITIHASNTHDLCHVVSFEPSGKQGVLPNCEELLKDLGEWQNDYNQITSSKRKIIGKNNVITNISQANINELLNKCQEKGKQVLTSFNCWLKFDSFLVEELSSHHSNSSSRVQILLQIDDRVKELERLPWHLAEVFEKFELTEVALFRASVSRSSNSRSNNIDNIKSGVRILAIFGDDTDINTQPDWDELQKILKSCDLVTLKPESQKELFDKLYNEQWDILFFAGHSSSNDKEGKGKIYLNNKCQGLDFGDISNAVNSAVKKGLKIAFFNSCDGLGLGHSLSELGVPQIILMREPVPDKVAQIFLGNFLTQYSQGSSFYQSVRYSREQLQNIQDKFPCAEWLPTIYRSSTDEPPTWKELKGQTNKYRVGVALLASLLVSTAIAATRFTGILQPMELNVFDSLMRARPQELSDQNILVVEVNSEDVENEIKKEKNGRSLSNESLDKLLKILDYYQPKAIGIDNYLDTDIDPKYQQLTKYLELGKLIAVCQAGDKSSKEAQAAPHNAKLIGFGDILPDAEGTHNQLKVGVVRRHLLAIVPQPICDPEFALSYELSKKYLHNLPVGKIYIDPPQDILQTGKRGVSLLTQRTGAYQKNLGDLGYQIMLNYRSHDLSIDRGVFKTISLKKIFDLFQQQDPQLQNLIANKIIIIGTTDDSRDLFKDNAQTPYGEIRGVFLQAQMTSQLVSAALENRPLIWAYSYWGELLIIFSVSIVGCLLFAILRRPLVLLLTSGSILLILYFGSVASLSVIGYWFPLLPSSLGLLSTGILVKIYLSNHQEKIIVNYINRTNEIKFLH
jgi:CHASE2 domain-containing sensor protein